jgi:ribosomal protein S12 methylthiotransferase
LLGGLTAQGFRLVDDPAQAEVVIVNTCGFIREAVEESIEEILEAARFKEQGACQVLVVAGCLPKRYPQIAAELPEVDHFFTPEQIPSVPRALGAVDGSRTGEDQGPRRLLTRLPHSAYLKIADGCSNRCTYCTIPSIRGEFRSLPEGTLLAEARSLVEQGTVELNLVAQDTTSYGLDRGDPPALARLLEGLEKLAGLRWLRLLYAYPRPFPPGVADLLAREGKVLPYLDIPIQHIHPRVLHAMGRKTSAAEVAATIQELRDGIPDLVLRTTVIVGFPGETDAEFETLLDFIRETRFHHLGAFAYSPEEGTPAAAIGGRVPDGVIEERLQHLLEAQAEVSAARNRAFLGRELDVLVEGFDEEGDVAGRTYGQAPEVDGYTKLFGYGDDAVETGSFVRARVVEAWEYDLGAEVTAL